MCVSRLGKHHGKVRYVVKTEAIGSEAGLGLGH